MMDFLSTLDNFLIRKAQVEDSDEIFSFLLNNYFKEDPIPLYCGLDRNERGASELWGIIKGALKENYSIVATNENQEILGVGIVVNHRKGFKFSNHYQFETEECQTFINVCEKIEKEGNAFEIFNVSSYGELFLLSSPPQLVNQMMKTSVEVMKNEKLTIFFVYCSTKEMKEAMTNLGGQILNTQLFHSANSSGPIKELPGHGTMIAKLQ